MSSLYFIGLVLYGMPLFLGKVSFVESYLHNIYYDEPIPAEIYIYFICGLSISLFLLTLQNRFPIKKIQISNAEYGWLLKFLVVLQLMYFLFYLKDFSISALLAGDKSYFVKNSSVFYFFCSYCSCLVILMGLAAKKKPYLFTLPSVFFLILDLFVGYRTNVFLLLCSIFLLNGLDDRPLKFFDRLKFAGIGLFIVLCAFVFKAIYYSISVGGLENIQFFTDTTFVGSEPFVILGNFLELKIQNFSHLSGEVVGSIIQYLPFSTSILNIEQISLNPFLQGQIFPKTEWGIASTGIGSLYFSFGFLGLVLYFFILASFQFLTHWSQSIETRLSLLLLAPYFFFYFHRNDWHAPFGTLKLFLISLMPLFATKLLRQLFLQFKLVSVQKAQRGQSIQDLY